MSTNRKNRDKPVLRNMVQSSRISKRNILTNQVRLDGKELRDIVDTINDTIQQLNRLISTRNIPYVRIQQSTETGNLDKTRVLLRSETSDSYDIDAIKTEFQESEGNTYLVELYLNDNGYIEIGCAADVPIATAELSNFLLVDYQYLSCALVDIFLDSAMFNSYSFLSKDLNIKDKREFNQTKVDFLRHTYNDFTSFAAPFYVFKNKRYSYLSMAFFFRKSESEIDLKGFITLWEEFINQTYPAATHIEPPVDDQLLSLVDLSQYSKDIISQCHQLSAGCYWLLRIHRVPTNEHIQKWLLSIFGQSEVGTEKIIEFSRFDTVYELVRAQHITAFKFIVQ